MNVIEKMDMFAESEPQMCVWCKHCGVVVCDGLWGYVCLRADNMKMLGKRNKGVIQPFPVNTGGHRTGVQCVNADEWHECFVPTKLTDGRIRTLDAIGLLPDDEK